MWRHWTVGGARAALPRYCVHSHLSPVLLVVRYFLSLVLVPPGDLLVLGVATETSCGLPPVLEATRRVWDGSSSPGSIAFYLCKEGFYEAGGQNQSVCGENAQWTSPSLSCRGNSTNPSKNYLISKIFTLHSFSKYVLYPFLYQRSHVGTLQHCPMLGRYGTEPPPLGASSLITVMRGFIPAEDTISRCAQLMVCGPTSACPAEVPLSPTTTSVFLR